MSTCPRCGAAFGCGMVDGDNGEPCWCTREPVLPRSAYQTDQSDPASARCLCPACLRAVREAARPAAE